jgi:hypothetical protein
MKFEAIWESVYVLTWKQLSYSVQVNKLFVHAYTCLLFDVEVLAAVARKRG